MMDDDYAQPRDVNSDLVEITTRLGEPDSTHRTNQASVAWRFALGVLIVVAAAILHFVMWTDVLPWPGGRHWKLWIILIAAMFIGPGVGLYLITFAVRGRKLWVLVYPTGLFVWHRGNVIAFPWDDVKSIQIAGMPDKAILHWPIDDDNPGGCAWYDLARSSRRVFGTTITLTRADGEQVALPSTLVDFAALGQRIQIETYRRLYLKMFEELQAGLVFAFGPVVCSRNEIAIGKKALRWAELASIERVQDKLELKKVGKKKAWAKCDFNEVVNPHVLMGIAAAAWPRQAPE